MTHSNTPPRWHTHRWLKRTDRGVAPPWGYSDPVNLGGPELLIVLIIILVLFGGAKLPKLARSLGEAQSEFKKGVSDTKNPNPADDDTPPSEG